MSDAILTIGDPGAAIVRARQHRGLTQARLAQQAGVSRQWVSEVEAGKRAGVEFSSVLRVARVLGLALALTPRDDARSGGALNAPSRGAQADGWDAEAHLRGLGVL